jgi:hypothetical protein
MKRVLPILLLGAIAFTIVAASGDSDQPPPITTRFRVAIVKVPVLGPDATPLRMADFGDKPAGAIRPMAGGPYADGLLGAIAYSPAVREKLLAREGAEVVCRGELESFGNRPAQLVTGVKFPLQTVSMRGGQPTVSTTYEQLGAKVQIVTNSPDLYDTHIEFSTMHLARGGRVPILSQFSSEGSLHLPDGYTSILSFMDRVDGDVTRQLPEEVLEVKEAEVVVPSIATQYFVLLTRMDQMK